MSHLRLVHSHKPDPNTPDLPRLRTMDDAYKLYDRPRFRVGDRTFKQLEPGTYSDGKITVFYDQQDSTSWAARVGSLFTSYYWAPEHAVANMLRSLEAAR